MYYIIYHILYHIYIYNYIHILYNIIYILHYMYMYMYIYIYICAKWKIMQGLVSKYMNIQHPQYNQHMGSIQANPCR